MVRVDAISFRNICGCGVTVRGERKEEVVARERREEWRNIRWARSGKPRFGVRFVQYIKCTQ